MGGTCPRGRGRRPPAAGWRWRGRRGRFASRVRRAAPRHARPGPAGPRSARRAGQHVGGRPERHQPRRQVLAGRRQIDGVAQGLARDRLDHRQHVLQPVRQLPVHRLHVFLGPLAGAEVPGDGALAERLAVRVRDREDREEDGDQFARDERANAQRAPLTLVGDEPHRPYDRPPCPSTSSRASFPPKRPRSRSSPACGRGGGSASRPSPLTASAARCASPTARRCLTTNS